MGKTTNFELNLAEGSQYVNPLTMDNPNYEKIDEVMKKNQDNSIQQATELVSGKIHAITCLVTDATFMRFTATGDFRIGDTFTYNGTPVTAFLPDGSGLSDYAYRINSEVLISVVGTRLTVYSYAAGSTTADNALALGGQPPEYYGRAADTIATYIQSKLGTVHNFVGNGSNGKVKIVANFETGDTIQINGVAVTAYAGAEDFISTVVGSDYIGKWLFFIYDSSSQTVNFKLGGGGRVTVEGLTAESIVSGITVTVTQGENVLRNVSGKYRVLAVHGGNLGAIVPNAVVWRGGKYVAVSVSKNEQITFDGTPLLAIGRVTYEQVNICGTTYNTTDGVFMKVSDFTTNSFVYNTSANAVASLVILGAE